MHASVSYALFCNCQQGIRHLGNGREVCPRNVHVNLRVMALRSPPRFSLQSRPQNGWQDLSKHKSPCVDHGRCMFSCEGTLISSAPLALLFRDQGTEVQITQPTKALKVSSIGQDAEVTSSNLDQIMLDPPRIGIRCHHAVSTNRKYSATCSAWASWSSVRTAEACHFCLTSASI